jgi:mannosyltransferase OCH1-like enzyme
MNIEDTFEDTPLKEWWEKGKLTNIKKYVRYSHLSDALRLALVYKNGGFYSDVDHIALRNFEPLTKFSVIINRPVKSISVESSFFHIKQYHGFLKVAMDDYAKNYDPKKWVEDF